jgi:hypothetical protein
MDVVSSIITELQMSILMYPTFRPLNHPPINAQSAAMLGSSFGQERLRPSGSELSAVMLGVVSTVALNLIKAVTRPATLAPDAWNAVHQRQQLSDVVTVCSS